MGEFKVIIHDVSDDYKFRLVNSLGLKSTLSTYNVPRSDLSVIAEKALGSKDHPAYAKVVNLLEDLY